MEKENLLIVVVFSQEKVLEDVRLTVKNLESSLL